MKSINFNERIPVILQSDFYKQSHAEQYPKGTTKLVSYATARMSRMEQQSLIVFGIQAFVKRWLIKEFDETFFSQPFDTVEAYYKWAIGNTFPLQYVDIEKFRKLHELGYLPIEVGCIEEGLDVPIRSAYTLPEGQCQVPFMYITNTHPDFAWLTEFLESLTSAEIWYPMCVANQAKTYRDIVDHWYNYTGCDQAACKSAIAEFGFRGGKGQEAATLASSAFLTSFNKTATIPAIIYNAEYYNEDITNGKVGSGMISTEHSVMCSNYAMDMEKYPVVEVAYEQLNVGDKVRLKDNENEVYEVVEKVGPNDSISDTDNDGWVYRYVSDDTAGIVLKDLGTVEDMFLLRLFTEIYPAGALSVVMDSYDYWHNVQTCGMVPHLKKAIMDRQGTVFFRGDSGDPVDIICGEESVNVDKLGELPNMWGTLRNNQLIHCKNDERYYRVKNEKHNTWIEAFKYALDDETGRFTKSGTGLSDSVYTTRYKVGYNKTANSYMMFEAVRCGYGNAEQYATDSGMLKACEEYTEFTSFNEMCMNLSENTSVHKEYDANGKCVAVYKVSVRNKGNNDTIDEILEDGVNTFHKLEDMPVEAKGTVELLWELFGGTVNEAGFKVLDSHVKAIYGDSITPVRAQEIYRRLAQKGFASCNVALGAGSFSMNCIETPDHKLLPFTRDSYGIAVKACYAENVSGKEYQIFKNPKTDTGKFKKSQRGMVYVTRDEKGEIVAYDGYTSDTIPKEGNLLKPIFRDGKMVHEVSLETVRNNIHNGKF